MVEPLLDEPLSGRRHAREKYLSNEVIAEPKAEAIDAQDPPLTQALELLDELGRLDAQQISNRFRLEGLVEDRGRKKDAVRPVTLGAALCEERSVSVSDGRAFRPFASASATRRGSPPVESCNSSIPTSARSSRESGSSRIRVSASRR